LLFFPEAQPDDVFDTFLMRSRAVATTASPDFENLLVSSLAFSLPLEDSPMTDAIEEAPF